MCIKSVLILKLTILFSCPGLSQFNNFFLPATKKNSKIILSDGTYNKFRQTSVIIAKSNQMRQAEYFKQIAVNLNLVDV